ncbi:MAG: S8 family serine peptidase [Atopobiaceae bacterium]|nr:S8 family serine peptidase [Atopobiaceae bacterium]
MATDMYIDQIAIGEPNNSGFLPYSYMNGTSMATPIVRGAAAIVSSGIDASSPAERAALTVQMLKSAVHQAPGYQGFCKQNGQLDLSLLSDAENLIPEI